MVRISGYLGETEAWKQRVDTINQRVKQVQDTNYGLVEQSSQLPDLTNQVKQLESVMDKWSEARQTSKHLTARYRSLASELEDQIDALRPQSTQLREALEARLNQRALIDPMLKQLRVLANQTALAQNISWQAYREAQERMGKFNSKWLTW
ncbi:unnamed protein product [Protopolystoma xenopodis]|uniref:Uncharacterized protein n=1 Tax=Protopolystoma xenopodis TaxID=117903 RepID=A0A448WKM6_9PLAT|nr:unnamed protein product [Protopolystoma xenopodis]